MSKIILASCAVAALLLLFALSSAQADAVDCKPSGAPPSSTGVVLVHGKMDTTGYWLMPLRRKLQAAGFRTASPVMPWAEKRQYDRTYEQSLDIIAEAARELEHQGAKRIVVAGHSLGANAALGYGALHDQVGGIIVISPGQFPEDAGYQKVVGESVAKARQLIAAGQGDRIGLFKDFAQWNGNLEGARTTAKNYLSYFDPNGNAVMPKNAKRIKPGTPVLWVVGSEDSGNVSDGKSYSYDKAPPDRLSRYILVPKGHDEAPATGADQIVSWLKCL